MPVAMIIDSSESRAAGFTLCEVFPLKLEAAARHRSTRDAGIRQLEDMGPKRFMLSVDGDTEFRTRCEWRCEFYTWLWVRLPWLAHDEASGPYIKIPQYRFNKTKQHTLLEKMSLSHPKKKIVRLAPPNVWAQWCLLILTVYLAISGWGLKNLRINLACMKTVSWAKFAGCKIGNILEVLLNVKKERWYRLWGGDQPGLARKVYACCWSQGLYTRKKEFRRHRTSYQDGQEYALGNRCAHNSTLMHCSAIDCARTEYVLPPASAVWQVNITVTGAGL